MKKTYIMPTVNMMEAEAAELLTASSLPINVEGDMPTIDSPEELLGRDLFPALP